MVDAAGGAGCHQSGRGDLNDGVVPALLWAAAGGSPGGWGVGGISAVLASGQPPDRSVRPAVRDSRVGGVTGRLVAPPLLPSPPICGVTEPEGSQTMGENMILHGDCLTLLPTLSANSAAMVLTDPPYLARYRDRSGRTVPNDDNDRWLVPAFAELYRVLANRSFCISFSGWPHADKFMSAYRSAGFRIVGHLLFPKRFASRTGLCAIRTRRRTCWPRASRPGPPNRSAT